MFTVSCAACGNETSKPRTVREGFVCADCAAFLSRPLASFEDAAVREAMEVKKLRVVA